MSFFFNDELNVNGKIINKDEIKTETINTAINSSIIAVAKNFYILNGTTLTVLLPEITSSNQGSEISFVLLKTNSRYITIYANLESNQKILNSGYGQDFTTNSNSTIEIVKYKSVFYPTDGVYFSISNTGSGYSTSDSITVAVTGGGGISAYCMVSIKTGIITGINIISGGSGYSPNDYLNFNTGSGSNFNGQLILDSNGSITDILIINGGENYSTSDFNFSGTPSGSGANISLIVSTKPVITFQNFGSGYSSLPTISVSGGSGTNLEITGTLNKGLWLPC